MSELAARRVLKPFGAQIELDLSSDVSETQIAALRRLFDAHHLLYFPGQKLTPERQRQVSNWFGPIDADKAPTTFSTDIEFGRAELVFHSDLSCAPEPLLGLSLYAVEVEEDAPPTLFVDAMATAAALPSALRARLRDLHILNLWPMSLNQRQRQESSPEDWPGTAHPLLKPHPRIGAPILYLNASHSDRIVELEPDDGERLIQDLFSRLYDGANRYTHHWKTGDFVIWDNLALQHARPKGAHEAVRTLRRVEIGSAGYAEQMPKDLYGL